METKSCKYIYSFKGQNLTHTMLTRQTRVDVSLHPQVILMFYPSLETSGLFKGFYIYIIIYLFIYFLVCLLFLLFDLTV